MRKQLTFVLRTGEVILPPKGPVEPQPGCQPHPAAPGLVPSAQPLSQEATRAAGSLQELLSLDQVLGLDNFLRGGESQKNGYLQMVNSDVNKAKKPYTTWIFPGHLPHCSCPVSKHRTREMSSQMSGVRLLGSAGTSDGPLGKLYMEVSPSGIC